MDLDHEPWIWITNSIGTNSSTHCSRLVYWLRHSRPRCMRTIWLSWITDSMARLAASTCLRPTVTNTYDSRTTIHYCTHKHVSHTHMSVTNYYLLHTYVCHELLSTIAQMCVIRYTAPLDVSEVLSHGYMQVTNYYLLPHMFVTNFMASLSACLWATLTNTYESRTATYFYIYILHELHRAFGSVDVSEVQGDINNVSHENKQCESRNTMHCYIYKCHELYFTLAVSMCQRPTVTN